MKSVGRRLFLAVSVFVLAGGSVAQAEEVQVPVPLQAELLSKVAAYDRNFAERAGVHVRVLVLTKPSDAQSVRVAAQIEKSLGEIDDVAGLPHSETIGAFTTPADLAATCRAKKYAIVWVTPGFGGEVEAIARALSGISVLTVSTIPGYVPKGIVLGFDSVSGKSKLLVNLSQARAQSVAFKPQMLKLMKVFE